MGIFDGITKSMQDIGGKLQAVINGVAAEPPKTSSGFFPQKLNSGQYLYKEYSGISICVISGEEPDFSQLHVGDWLELRKEPFNKNDPKAVAVYDRFQRIGYLYRGIGQDMSNDFIEKGYAVFAVLSAIDGTALYMNCAYYKRHASASRK